MHSRGGDGPERCGEQHQPHPGPNLALGKTTTASTSRPIGVLVEAVVILPRARFAPGLTLLTTTFWTSPAEAVPVSSAQRLDSVRKAESLPSRNHRMVFEEELR